LLVSNYNAVQLFVSIIGLLGAGFYFYRMNFLTTYNYLILCFLFLGEEAGVFFMQEEALFLFMPANYLLVALFLTISGQLFITSVFLTMFAFAIDQLSRIAVDSLFMFYEMDFFPTWNVVRWLAVFTMIRLLLFLFQDRLYNWFIYKSHILQITVFLKKKNAFILSILFFAFFLGLKLFFGSPIFAFQRFYLTFSSAVFFLILLFVSLAGILLSKQKQQLSLHIEKQAAAELSLANIQTLTHDFNNILYTLAELIKHNDKEEALAYISSISNYINEEIPVRNYHRIEQMKNHWLKHYLVSALKKCRQQNISVELQVQEMEQILDDFLMIDAVRCLSILFDNAVEECTNQEKTTIKVDLYIESRYIDCKIVNSLHTSKKAKMDCAKNGFTTKPGHQGIGLTSIDRIVSKYRQGEFYFKQAKKEFTTQFVLRKNE
jgi:two-component system sensor histidine kinase AgrC